MAHQYNIRQQSLSLLGFASYDEYLKSELWLTIKSVVLTQNPRCQICAKRKAYTAHHVSYTVAVLAGRDMGQLVACCRGCHKHIEFEAEQKRVDCSEIYREMRAAMVSRRGGSATKKVRKESKPRCRCCGQQRKRLGREGICLQCFKRFGARVHDMAVARDLKYVMDIQARTVSPGGDNESAAPGA